MKSLSVILLVFGSLFPSAAGPVGATPSHGINATVYCTRTDLALAKKSALYMLLEAKLGEPRPCAVKEGGIVMGFAQGGMYKRSARVGEVSVEEASIAQGPVTVSREEAIASLKKLAADTGAYPPFAVKWEKLGATVPSGTADLIEQVEACNFRVHLQIRNNVVTGWGSSMAC
jgi:hypothetical protein